MTTKRINTTVSTVKVGSFGGDNPDSIIATDCIDRASDALRDLRDSGKIGHYEYDQARVALDLVHKIAWQPIKDAVDEDIEAYKAYEAKRAAKAVGQA